MSAYPYRDDDGVLQRSAPTAEGLARVFAASLKAGKNGTPRIVEHFGKLDGSSGGFVVETVETGERYRVTVSSEGRPA